MAGYHAELISELARQLEFTPTAVRRAQVDAAEELLFDIQPDKAYPFDFIVFRITGFAPRTPSTAAAGAGEALLPGIALHHDLGRLIEDVSDSLAIETTSVGEPVLTIEDLVEKFNVTSKTIQRWRRRGLPARRYVFPDGKRRVGFIVRSVERFIQLHSDEISQATNFSQLRDEERDNIISRARRLAVSCQCCVNEIARRIAKKLRRSPLTILHTIRKYDAEHPADAIFALAAAPVPLEDRARIVKSYRRGLSLRVLARRSCRPRSVVYRVIVEERIERLNRRKQKFIDDTLYHQEDAASVIDALVANEELAAPRASDERMPRDLPAYFQALYRTPLLTPGRERALFLKFNYHKFLFVTSRRELDTNNSRGKDVAKLERYLKLATETKNVIVAANLRLVVSIARRHLRPSLNLMELVSDGNVTLMRAVESFDFHKGNKFSTYATLALMKGFARSVPLMLSSKRKAGMGDDALSGVMAAQGSSTSQLANHDELRKLLKLLDPAERAVLLAKYGVPSDSTTLGEVAPTCTEMQHAQTLSRTRIRQIEQRAMDKLRVAVGLSA